jgi:hypothetical protein
MTAGALHPLPRLRKSQVFQGDHPRDGTVGVPLDDFLEEIGVTLHGEFYMG